MAAVAAAMAIRATTFSPWATDAAAYVEAGHRWAKGRIVEPSPIPLWAIWTRDGDVTAPHAYRRGTETGTDVIEYPSGLPILMAAGIWLFGDLGPYLVAPLSLGLLVLAVYAVAKQLAGEWCGVTAAALVCASPITGVSAVQPMSDVPATALWVLAWAMSLRPGFGAALAAGAASAAAVMVRPNLGPFAMVIAATVLTSSEPARTSRTWWALASYLAVTSLGVVVVAWSQASLYGSMFTPGHRDIERLFAWAYVGRNVELHGRHLLAMHSWAIGLGLFAPLMYLRAPAVATFPAARRVTLGSLGIIALTLVVYLPYVPFEDPHFLRFLLPGLVAVFVLLAGLTAWLWRAANRLTKWLTPLALAPALVVAGWPGPILRYPLDFHLGQEHIAYLGPYLQAAVPPNAVVLAQLHGGAARHYTGMPVVRLDLIEPAMLDGIVDDLSKHGYEPVMVVDQLELEPFRARFAQSRYGALDWSPRAMASSSGMVQYLRFADADRYRRGLRWPVDVASPTPSLPRPQP